MSPDSENPFAPPRETNITGPVREGLSWSYGVREIILTLIVFFGFFGGFVVAFFISGGSMLPFDLDSTPDGGQALERMLAQASVAALFVLGLLLWNQQTLFSLGGLIALAIGLQMWIIAAVAVLMPSGSLLIWGIAVVVLILGRLLLRGQLP